MALLPESVRAETGTGTERGDVIDYAASATGTAYSVIDPASLVERVRGLSVSEARSILEAYGTVTRDGLARLRGHASRGRRTGSTSPLQGPSASDATDGG